MQDKCPFCGADIRFQCCRLSSLVGIIEIEYFCGTLKDTDRYHQSGECKDRQISALQAALAEKEERLSAWRKLAEDVGGSLEMENDLDRTDPYFEVVVNRQAVEKLKDLGEIP